MIRGFFLKDGLLMFNKESTVCLGGNDLFVPSKYIYKYIKKYYPEVKSIFKPNRSHTCTIEEYNAI